MRRYATADEIMQMDVVCLHALSPIDRAIEVFEEYGISGAPVVDEAEQLVGVLSATDILRRDQEHVNEDESRRPVYYASDPFGEESEFFSTEEYLPDVLGRELVCDFMTDHVISVAPKTPLPEICDLMASEKVHRVLVVNERRVLGIISTFDIVRHISQYAQETRATA